MTSSTITTTTTYPPPGDHVSTPSAPLKVQIQGPENGRERLHDVESQPPSPTRDLQAMNIVEAKSSSSGLDRDAKWKVFGTTFAVFIAGINDASTGALIPYLRAHYGIGLGFVALVYIVNFVGWLAAGVTNVHLGSRLGLGGMMFLGSCLQLVAYVIMAFQPTYGLYVAAFFFSGIGVAYQDAQANTYQANLPRAHLYLGFLHALYGVGALVAPLIATAIATSDSTYRRWYYFYFIALGLAVINCFVNAIVFRADIVAAWKNNVKSRGSNAPNAQDEAIRQEENAAKKAKANQDFKRIVKRKEVWVLCLYLFLYVGTEVTAGGWVVEFLISVRHGNPSKVGYVASAFWGGLTLGRIVLAEPTNRFGERRMVLLYTAAALTVQLIFWFLPSIIVSSVMIGLLGFFIGPNFPVAISLATKLLPRELHSGAIGFMSTTGISGSAAFPYLTGAIAASKGVKVLQPILVSLLVGQMVLWCLVPRVRRPTN